MEYIFILGRQHVLSASEALAVLKARGYSPTVGTVNKNYLLVSVTKDLDPSFIHGLGGTQKIARVIQEQTQPFVAENIVASLSPLPPKFRLGLSSFYTHDRGKFGQTIKDLVKEAGSKIRFILPSGSSMTLNAAQVIFNKLTTAPNRELLLFHHEKRYLVAETIAVQDIQAYEHRDTARPDRDMKVGLLPPKLAQIMINLAVSHKQQSESLTLLDPFCGMGTILQEGWLQGHQMIGSDIDQAMVDASITNLQYLANSSPSLNGDKKPIVFQHDIQAPFPENMHNTIDGVITEPYLGKPLSRPLSLVEFQKTTEELFRLYQSFFQAISPVLKDNAFILFLLPAFKVQEGRSSQFRLFPHHYLDFISKIGYFATELIPSEISAKPEESLVYHRPDALVGRELTLWYKKS